MDVPRASAVLAAGARGVVASDVPMDCAVCQSPVDADATRCAACGASLYEDDEAATIAGSRFTDVGALVPVGEVLAERWELEERLGVEGPFARFRAIDQESDARVSVTVFARELLPGVAEREAVRERLAACVGVGNRYVPGLLDVDRERTLLFVVEPLVAGPTLRSLLDARRARGESMQVSEVLPVVAQLAAALAGLPPPYRHGDVRAERVVVGREGLRLMSPFMLPALSGPALARLLAPDDTWRRALAPEVLRGMAGDAADRFGVATIALEALTGHPPGGAFPSLRGELAPVEEALRELLARDPATRPSSLVALVEALAECAHLPAPDLDPSPFRRVRRSGASRVGPAEVAASSASEEPRAVGADTTLRTAALDAEGRPQTGVPWLQIPDIQGDPGESERALGESVEPATVVAPRAAIPGLGEVRALVAPLVKDALPAAYRLDEGPTLAERERDTRRVVAVSEDDAPSVLAGLATADASASSASPRRDSPLPPPRRAVAGAAQGGTQEISMDEVFESRANAGSAADSGIDPRLLRAARAPRPIVADTEPPPADDEADPSPVRRGGETQQLNVSDLAEVRDEGAARRAPLPSSRPAPVSVRPATVARAARLPAPEARPPLPSLRRSSPPGPIAGTVPLPADARRPRREPITEDTPAEEPPTIAVAPSALPRRPLPAPASVRPPAPGPRTASERPLAGPTRPTPTSERPPHAAVSPATSAPPRPGPIPSQVVRAQPSASASLPGTIPLASRLASSELPGTAPLAPDALPISHGPTTGAHAQRLRQRAPTARVDDLAPRPPARTSGSVVLWASVLVALAIVCVGAFIAWRREAAQQRERQRIYQERIEQVRRQNQ